jgi:cellulose biosynthesis protein BcsQ
MSQASDCRKIVIFNHKGGVGKTTLTVNIASALAEMGKKVLCVDSDPQCNLTSYFYSDKDVDGWLDKSESEEGATIWSVVKDVFDEAGDYKLIFPITTPIKNLYSIPGDILLSECEEDLSDAWTMCLKRKIGSYKKTTALSRYVQQLIDNFNFDFVFFDSGPNIGPLNRVILLDCDYFIIPAACDVFSVRALKTLGHTLVKWIDEWNTVRMLAPDEIYLFKGKPRFLGYIPQKFRVYGGSPSIEFRSFLPELEKRIQSEIIVELKRIDETLVNGTTKIQLGSVQDFGSLAINAQKSKIPLWHVSAVNEDLRAKAEKSFREIAKEIIQKTQKIHD